MLANLDPLGGARMVDVTPREPTHRRALARCRVSMLPETTTKVANNAITKGDVLAAARIAGIQAAKRTAELIPMCHPVLVGSIGVNFSIGDDYVEVEAQVETVDRTGVEMEAMTACAVAALTVYDMCKSSDRTMTVEHLALWEKSGGGRGPGAGPRSTTCIRPRSPWPGASSSLRGRRPRWPDAPLCPVYIRSRSPEWKRRRRRQGNRRRHHVGGRANRGAHAVRPLPRHPADARVPPTPTGAGC